MRTEAERQEARMKHIEESISRVETQLDRMEQRIIVLVRTLEHAGVTIERGKIND